MLHLPHHDGSPLHVPCQNPSLGDTVPLLVRVPHGSASMTTRGVWLRGVRDGEPRIAPATVDHRTSDATWWRADLLVHNPLTPYRFALAGDAGRLTWLTAEGLFDRDVTDAGDFRLQADPSDPDWAQDATVYQVFPDRFARSGASHPTPSWAVPSAWDEPVRSNHPLVGRQWYGGDLPGVAQHLDHLESLHADVLYLTPIWPAGSNHRYDARTFDHVDPVLGGDEGLAGLTAAAHARGIRVMGDLTTNHTGVTHEWFERAQADPTATEAGFYLFQEHPDRYASWLEVPSLPKLDHTSPVLRELLTGGPDSVVRRWLRPPYALDGWRIDVANMTGRYAGTDVGHEVARDVRRAMDAEGGATWLLAEHGHDAGPDLGVGGWDGTMAYTAFTRPVWTWLNQPGHGRTYLGLPVEVPTWDGRATVATMQAFAARMPWRSRLASVNQLGSHDTPRFRTVVGAARQLVGLTMMATLPGAPMVFAGDEIGLTGLDGEHSRTPFPWDAPQGWDQRTLAAYRELLGLRRRHEALRRGGLRFAHVGADSITYLRELAGERLLVHVARAPHPQVRLSTDDLGTDRAELVHAVRDETPQTLASGHLRTAGSEIGLPGDGPATSVYLLG